MWKHNCIRREVVEPIANARLICIQRRSLQSGCIKTFYHLNNHNPSYEHHSLIATLVLNLPLITSEERGRGCKNEVILKMCLLNVELLTCTKIYFATFCRQMLARLKYWFCRFTFHSPPNLKDNLTDWWDWGLESKVEVGR